MRTPAEFVDTPEEWEALQACVRPGAEDINATPALSEMLESFAGSGLMTVTDAGAYRVTQRGREYVFGLLKRGM